MEDEAPGLVQGGARGRHDVLQPYAGAALDFAHAKFEQRTIKKVEANGQHGVMAVEVAMLRKQKRRISTLVLVGNGNAYALTCADGELNATSDVCKAVFRSLEVDGAE